MVSKLYSADILGAATPVDEESVQQNIQKVKKPRKQKNVDEEPVTQPAEVEAPVAAPPVKEKKPRTEKQIAAAARMVEARRYKKECEQAKIAEIEAEKVRLEAQLVEKEAQRAAKKEEARLRRLEKKTASVVADTTADAPVDEETNKKVKRQKTDDEHPRWMPHLIAEVKSALDTTKSKRQIANESKSEAQKKWEDPLVRSRVADVQNNTANKLFSSIFPGRKL